MAPSPIPAPLPPWARAFLQLAPLIPNFLQDLLEYIGVLEDAEADVPGSWRRAQLVWKDVASTDTADNMTFSLDLANITGGTIDPTWTDADYTAVNGQVAQMASQVAGLGQARLRHVETRYYRMAFNPMGHIQPFQISGPPERVFPGTAAGLTGQPPQANQVAFTFTEKTAYPRHWGRGYIPLPTSGNLSADGHIATVAVDALAASVHELYNDLMSIEFFPVVPVTQVLGQSSRGLLTVTAVQVDNVPDVIRRRRLHTTTYRKVLGLV